ncbi:MAG: hypothetical protein ACK6DY_23965 [Acidobacteriota bacterium]
MSTVGALLEACPASPVAMDYTDLPASARALAADLGLTPDSFPAHRAARRQLLAERIVAGSAEQITYYLLQSRSFTALPPVVPLALARLPDRALLPAAAPRLAAWREATRASDPDADERRRLVAGLYRGLPAAWTLERCYLHTMEFLRDRLLGEQAPDAVNALYQRRGLLADSARASTAVLAAAQERLGQPQRILLAGPGLDLTRREGFDDAAPLEQPQWDGLRRRWGAAPGLDAADVRPEVLAFLRGRQRCAIEADITTEIPAIAAYDLIVATNLFVYLDDRGLLLALAALARALRPGGLLLHNDGRFAAKVFGGAVGLPVIHFTPVSLGLRNGREQMDRAVLHRR